MSLLELDGGELEGWVTGEAGRLAGRKKDGCLSALIIVTYF